MDQAFKCYLKQRGDSRRTPVIEGSLTKHQEDCKRRVAMAQNGVPPEEIAKRVPRK